MSETNEGWSKQYAGESAKPIQPVRRDGVGEIAVDHGNMALVSMQILETLMGIANQYHETGSTIEDQVRALGGVFLEFNADGSYGVDRVTVVDSANREWDAVLIGGPQNDTVDLARLS